MELTHDWKSFQSLFFPRRTPVQASVEAVSPIFLIVDKNTILTAFADGENFSDWIGKSFDAISAEFSHRKIVTFDCAQVESWVKESLPFPHFFDQQEYIINQASDNKKNKICGSSHFLLETLQSNWRRILPDSYGLLIQTQQQPIENFFLIFKNGKLKLFQKADLSAIGPERSKSPEDIVKYLSEKHMVPVQGFFLPQMEDWMEWTQAVRPWSKVRSSLRSKKAKLVPFRLGMSSLITVKALLGK